MNQPRRGRPPVLDEHKRGQIYGVLSVGGSMALAADAVGCCVRTIYNTMERDEKFKEELKRARAGSEIRLLKCIDDAALEPRYWRAAAWKLERLRPERYRSQPSGKYTLANLNTIVEQFLVVIQETIEQHTIVPEKTEESRRVGARTHLSPEKTEHGGCKQPPYNSDDHHGSALAKPVAPEGKKPTPDTPRGSALAVKPPVAPDAGHEQTPTPEQQAKAALFDEILTRLQARMNQYAIESDDSLGDLLDYLHLPTKDPPADAA